MKTLFRQDHLCIVVTRREKPLLVDALVSGRLDFSPYALKCSPGFWSSVYFRIGYPNDGHELVFGAVREALMRAAPQYVQTSLEREVTDCISVGIRNEEIEEEVGLSISLVFVCEIVFITVVGVQTWEAPASCVADSLEALPVTKESA